MLIRVIGGPWPERIGRTGVIVKAPDGPKRYPFSGLGKDEVVILLDEDAPLIEVAYRGIATAPRPGTSGAGPWTCVIGRKHLESVVGSVA